jgi:hypothetical protein
MDSSSGSTPRYPETRDSGAPRTDAAASREEDVRAKARLDAWLDDALEDTFPASDPVASPPAGAGDGPRR